MSTSQRPSCRTLHSALYSTGLKRFLQTPLAQPGAHVQLKLFVRLPTAEPLFFFHEVDSLHLAPFLQGFARHSFTSSWQRAPVQPSAHVHLVFSTPTLAPLLVS